MCSSEEYFAFSNEINKCIQKGEEPFDGYNELKDFLFKRSTLSRNNPLFFSILNSLKEYTQRKCIIFPPPFPLIKSCVTKDVYLKFMNDYKEELDKVDLMRPKTVFSLLSSIKLRGILILSGLRHTVGSM